MEALGLGAILEMLVDEDKRVGGCGEHFVAEMTGTITHILTPLRGPVDTAEPEQRAGRRTQHFCHASIRALNFPHATLQAAGGLCRQIHDTIVATRGEKVKLSLRRKTSKTSFTSSVAHD